MRGEGEQGRARGIALKRRETQKVAIRIVQAYLADMGGAELGWTYGPGERRLRKTIENELIAARIAGANSATDILARGGSR